MIKRVGVWSVARVFGSLYGCLGLVFGLIVAAAALLGAGFARATEGASAPPAVVGALLGVGAVVFLPVLYGTMGLVMGALTAWLYNLFSSVVGGIEVDLEGPTPGADVHRVAL